MISVLIPSSLGAQESDSKLRAYLIGEVARALTIFKVQKLIIYPDPMLKTNSSRVKEVVTLLQYANTPQYLRKYIFKYEKELKQAGALPPLQAPHHPERNEKVEYRYGFVKELTKKGSLVDLGLDSPILCAQKLPAKKIALFKLSSNNEWHPVSKNTVTGYFGYDIEVCTESLTDILKKLRSEGNVVIGTSKYGIPVERIFYELSAKVKSSDKLAVAFGSYAHGFFSWFSKEDCKKMFDLVINVQSTQGTKTIRTEEALFLSLETLDLAKKIQI
ncbi:MAG: RNA methyltransferase [Candidatus Thermoplasmatota archaeon]